MATEPHFHQPIRSDLDVAIDLAWHRMKHASDPVVVERYAREHSDLLNQRAALLQAQGAARPAEAAAIGLRAEAGVLRDAARALRDLGVERATRGAGPEWNAAADAFLRAYIATRDTVTTGEIRQAAAGIVPDPREPRSWGGVTSRAARAGLLESTRTTRPHPDPRRHAAPETVWQVLPAARGQVAP